ncbi:MAG: zinc ribbon domain-containing protein [Betaproteobacteria bacterium]|nr:zinc ribbon domain-containing protein [Betaproteobacteria bacterium]
MTDSAYPQPTLTSTNAPLIEGWRRGELMLQHCNACHAVIFFPRHMCPTCWSVDIAWKRSSGRGKIVSYSHVYSHVTPPFSAEAPTILAEIVLDDGGAMLARVISSEPAAIASNMRVELLPMPEAAQYPLPTFRPAK